MQRTLPHNLEAEAAVLGAMMLNHKAVAIVIAKLEPEDFYLEHHAQIYRAVATLFTKGSPVDSLTISAELVNMKQLERVGGNAFLAEIQQNVPTAANADHYAQEVRDLSAKRALVHAGERTVSLGYDSGTTASDAFDQSQAVIYGAWKDRMLHNSIPIAEALRDTWDLIANLSGKPAGLPTGFYDFDSMSGGLKGGELVLLAARPAVGKTALALNITAHVAKYVPVGFFSLEMSPSQLMSRLISGRAQIDHSRVQKGDLTESEWSRVALAVGELSALPIIIEEATRLSNVELRARARRLKMTAAIGMIVVDYLQLMDVAPKMDSRVQEVTEISRSLKALARELDVPVIACAQLNREVERRGDRTPQLSDLRESGALEQDADLVAFLHRPASYDGSNSPEAQVIIAKHRNGPTGMVKLVFKPEYVRFLNQARPGVASNLGARTPQVATI